MFHIGVRLLSVEPKFGALSVHVRFAKCERINVRLVLQVRQRVVDEPVGAFVGTDGVHDVQQGRVVFETPVILGDLWSGMLRPLWETALFDVFNTFLSFRTSGRGYRRED